MADKDTGLVVPSEDEAKLIAEYAQFAGEAATHDAQPLGTPMLRWRHMGANTADAEGGKFYNSLEGNDVAYDELPAIIIDGKNSRAFYRTAYDPKKAKAGDVSQPDCKSTDGITGVGDPGGECRTCPMSQWGQDGSPPPCALSYDRLIYDFHTNQLGVISFARSKIKAIQAFHQAIRARNGGTIPMWAYKITMRSEKKDAYWVPRIDIDGVLPKQEALKMLELKKEANASFMRQNSAESGVAPAAATAPEDLEAKDAAGAYS